MKTNAYLGDFREAFHDMGRGNQFSYEGMEALYDYLCEYEEDCDTEIELDVIALCCEFSEYDDWEEFRSDYTDTATEIENEILDNEFAIYTEDGLTEQLLNELSIDNSIIFDIDDFHKLCVEKLQEHTTVINVGYDGFIIQSF